MEIVFQTVGIIMGKMVDCVFVEVGKQFGYLINNHNHVTTLEAGVRNLKIEREELGRRIEAATRNLEEIEPKVGNWCKDVDRLISETGNLLERNNHRCINGKCVNLWSRYKSGKEAWKKATKISKYQGIKFESVSHPVPQPEIKLVSSTTLFSGIESRRSILKDIMEALDDASINVIGITGMGGVGKTTIVEEVYRQATEKKCFDVVAMVVVSQTPNLPMIQDKIAHKLGLDLASRNESERAPALWNRIKQERKILIILDDAWSKLELTKIGIPFGRDHAGCKIVLTSRSEDVCNEMDAQKIFPIQGLPKQEAWELFRKTVGEDIDSSELNSVAREIVGDCRGLPLAIVTVGGALKKRSKEIWIDAAAQLKRPVPAVNIRGMEPFLYSRLKLSYEYLNDKEAKSLFLLCSLFPEDSLISIELLVKYGTGLMLFKDVDTIEDARVRAYALVHILLSSFLLLEVKNRPRYVKMHDVVRDVAILIASEEENRYLVKAGCGLKEWPTNDPTFDKYRGISLVRNGIHKLPDGLECPKLQILLLDELELHPDFKFHSFDFHYQARTGRISQEKEIPINFFQGMKDLKVLDMSGNCVLPFLPTSVAMLTTLQTLVLDGCLLGDNVSIIGTLKQLEILSLRGSDVTVVPEHFSQLTRIRVLDLKDCGLVQISQGVISNLGKLEEMYIPEFDNWAAEEGEEDSRSSASLSELNSLCRLTSLSFSAKEIDILPVDFKFQKLIRFEINIRFHSRLLSFHRWEERMSGFNILRKKMSFGECDMRLISGPIEVLLKKVEGLNLEYCRNLENIIQGQYSHILYVLKLLEIKNSHEMEYLVDMVNWARKVVLPNLDFLELSVLNKLRGICHGHVPLPAESFGKLTRLHLISCGSMLNVAESNLLRRFQCLQHLLVLECANLLSVFDFEGLAIEVEDADSLSRLETLRLSYLPKLMYVWKTPRHFVNLCNLKHVQVGNCGKLRQLFPLSLVQGLVHLETVYVRGCNNLEQIFGTDYKEEGGMEIVNEVKRISPRTSTSLQCLTEVKVRKCERLRNIFHPSLLKGLVQLKMLTLASCEMLEAVIEDDERGVLEETVSSSIEKITFPLLHSIEFYCMDNLTCFCKGRLTAEYPSLEVVSIVECPSMETFGHGVQITPKLKKVLISREKEESWMGDLNGTVQHLCRK